MGRIFNSVHRVRRGRLHGPVERQPRLHIDGQLDHVHRFLGGLHRAHMLRVHVVESHASQGPRPGKLVRAGPADHPGRHQHDPGRLGTDPGRQLHIHGVLQDDIPGDRVRRAARHVPAAGAPVAVRPGRVQRLRPQKTPFVHPQISTAPVLYTAPVVAPSHGPAGLQQGETVPRRVGHAQAELQLEAGQGHGPGDVGGLQREQFVQVATEEDDGGGGRRGTEAEVHGRLEESHRSLRATAENRRGLPRQRLLQ